MILIFALALSLMGTDIATGATATADNSPWCYDDMQTNPHRFRNPAGTCSARTPVGLAELRDGPAGPALASVPVVTDADTIVVAAPVVSVTVAELRPVLAVATVPQVRREALRQ